MDTIVSVVVELERGQKSYFLTWGRIQHAIDGSPLEALVLKQAARFELGGTPKRARVCRTLQEASRQPYFYESFFTMCQTVIPSGRHHGAWRRRMDTLMRRGKELYYLGNPRRSSPRL
jgi:hypothetical protein